MSFAPACPTKRTRLQKDGVLSGVLSRQIAASPALRAVLGPVHDALIAAGL